MFETRNFFYNLKNDSDINFSIKPGIVYDLETTPTFNRLYGIRTIRNVRYNIITEKKNTRGKHSLMTALIADKVAERNNLDKFSSDVLVAASLLHDIEMPPYSDFGKLMIQMDESEHNGKLIENDDISKVLGKYSINKEDIERCSKGIHENFGKVLNANGSLDIDRIAYTIYDSFLLFQAENGYFRKLKEKIGDIDLGNFFNFFSEIGFDNEGVYIENPEIAKNIIRTRAYMFREVYCNSETRARMAFLSKELKSVKSRAGIGLKDLLKMNDEDFYRLVSQYSDFSARLLEEWESSVYETIRFRRLEDINNEIIGKKGKAVIKHNSFDTALNTRVKDGKLYMFKDVFPQVSAEIEDIAKSLEYTAIYERKIR